MSLAQQQQMLNMPIVLLKDGSDQSQGKGQLLSNIGACIAVADTIRTTLGPLGCDKLIVDKNGRVTISNDGATIMKLLDIVHPAAKSLVDIARAQDAQVGDGTTSTVLIAAEILKQVKTLVEDNVNPQVIIKSLRKAGLEANKQIGDASVDLTVTGDALRDVLLKCATTSMSSKLIHSNKDFFGKMVVDAVLKLDDKDSLNESFIAMKKVHGGGMEDSVVVDGVAFKKTFSYAGFEQQPKLFENPKIICLNVELELKAEKDNAEVRIDKVSEYQKVVDAEWRIIYEKLENLVKTGANVVLSRLPIGDLATQYFADRGIFCAGRIPADDLLRVTKAVDCTIHSSIHDLSASHLGTCAHFKEEFIGGQRFNLFTGCKNSKTSTLILRGGAEQFLAEVERSLHDAIMIVRRAIKNKSVVAGGGAIDMALSQHLRTKAFELKGKSQLIFMAFAQALEIIPRQLILNSGLDATDLMNLLRQAHTKQSGHYMGENSGVDLDAGVVVDTYKSFVWEPEIVKRNAISSAVEAACLILSIDETVKNPESAPPQSGLPGQPGRG